MMDVVIPPDRLDAVQSEARAQGPVDHALGSAIGHLEGGDFRSGLTMPPMLGRSAGRGSRPATGNEWRWSVSVRDTRFSAIAAFFTAWFALLTALMQIARGDIQE
jgi:hypothetical protein